MTLRRRGSPVALRLWPSPAAKVDHTLNPQLSTLRSFNHFFKLRTEHSSVVAIKRDMEPIPFFALDDEFCRVGKICCPWSVISRLRDYVDHQVPGSRLACVCQGACDRLLC